MGSTKVWLFVLGMGILHLLVGYQLGGRWGLLIGFSLAILMVIACYFFGEGALPTELPGDLLAGQDSWGVLDIVAKYSRKLNMTAPRVELVDGAMPICFALASPWRPGIITISTAVLARMTAPEKEALLIFLLCKLRKQQRFGFAITNMMANSFTGMANFLDQKFGNHGPFTRILTPLAWMILRLSLKPKLYLEADHMAAGLMHDKLALGKALWKLSSLTDARPINPPACSSHFFAVNPIRTQLHWWAKVHPDLKARIRLLVGHYPI